jgi:mono/diheme cytochrome c family protein
VLLALSTGNKIGLAAFAAVFVAFALLSALVIPRWRPDFPGERGRGWFVTATIALFVAMLFAVEVFAKEEEAAHEPEAAAVEEPGAGETMPAETGQTETAPTETAPAPAGDAQAGRQLFTAQGCGGCHAFDAAGTSASVGPDLDESLQDQDADYVRRGVVEPNADVAEGYAPNIMPQDYGEKLSDEQLTDLVAFLTAS